jgi:hypothetical protein
MQDSREASLPDMQASPADMQASPADMQAPPADMQASPADMQASPADMQASPADMQATASTEHASEETPNNTQQPERGRAYRIPEDVCVLDELTSPVFIIDFSPEVDSNVWVNRRCCQIMNKTVDEMVAVDFKEGRSTFVRDLMLEVHDKVQTRGLSHVQMRKTLFYDGVVSTCIHASNTHHACIYIDIRMYMFIHILYMYIFCLRIRAYLCVYDAYSYIHYSHTRHISKHTSACPRPKPITTSTTHTHTHTHTHTGTHTHTHIHTSNTGMPHMHTFCRRAIYTFIKHKTEKNTKHTHAGVSNAQIHHAHTFTHAP